MLTVTYGRDRRTWYGRQLYKIRIEYSAGGSLTIDSARPYDTRQILTRILEREVANGRPFRVIDEQQNRTMNAGSLR